MGAVPLPEVVLVDAGGSNIGSVQAALERLGVAASMTTDADRIRCASHVILPGVGAAQPGMARLEAAGLVPVIKTLKQPVLGVCLGMQLLFERSEESETACLGLIPGTVRKFDAALCGRVPHMGWNQIKRCKDSPLLEGITDGDYVYFVHSYAAPITAATLMSCDYGNDFSAIVARDNFYGAQFHPERSADVGARLLQNFLGLSS